MDDSPEDILKKICCTCLSNDRKLYQLCRLLDGVNNLYLLLSYDSEAYREGFYKDTANLFICWECKAVMGKIMEFRKQACNAQRKLTSISEGQTDIKLLTKLSHLTANYKFDYDVTLTFEAVNEKLTDNFIDCGPIDAIKTESDLDDIPLSELHNNYTYDTDNYSNIETNENLDTLPKKTRYSKKNLMPKKSKLNYDSYKKYYTTKVMTEEEAFESREGRKLAVKYADALFKCESCVEVLQSHNCLERHNFALHTEKKKYSQCDICLCYIKTVSLPNHRSEHFLKFTCNFCECVTYSLSDILRHLKSVHAMRKLVVPIKRKKGHRKTPIVIKPGSKPRRNQTMLDKRTPYGYMCMECDKYFENKNQRWKHVQRFHREGFKCTTCGKRFAFKNNLSRHEQLHQGPPPREECQICHKMIRVDLMKIHARIHSNREKFTCIECEKSFISRASYEHHLKYTQAHSAGNILKYKCSMCDKGYRSRGELRDHVNYQHMGKTQHKCPVCGKALATRRCITRHVKRAHDGVKESARDKICQQCGKAFRDKKGLREHEFIHTGERPLSCEICGCTFRQSASLYTHRKRVHNIYPAKKNVQLVESVAQESRERLME